MKRAMIPRFWLCVAEVVTAFSVLNGIFFWRLLNPGESPDVGDPFDVDEARRPVALTDDDNSYAAYANARLKLADIPEAIGDAAWSAKEDGLRWPKVEESVRQCREMNRAAMEIGETEASGATPCITNRVITRSRCFMG